MKQQYSIKQIADLAGVSIRTLRYYDEIGLLTPAYRSESGYRYYDRKELLILQQILFYKSFGISLLEIKEILLDPQFDLLTALEKHKKKLEAQQKHFQVLIATINNTIQELQKNIMMKDEEIYEGFEPKKIKALRQEVINRWGANELEEAENNIRQLGKDKWKDVKAQEKAINDALSALMYLSPGHQKVQLLIKQHHQYLNQFYEVKEERYRGLAKMYVDDERFRNHYDQHREGFAQFLKMAIEEYCDRGMKGEE